MAKTCPDGDATPLGATPGGQSLEHQEAAWKSFKPALSQKEWQGVREDRMNEMSAEDIAGERNVDVEVIERAFQAVTYDTFMRLERKAAGL